MDLLQQQCHETSYLLIMIIYILLNFFVGGKPQGKYGNTKKYTLFTLIRCKFLLTKTHSFLHP